MDMDGKSQKPGSSAQKKKVQELGDFVLQERIGKGAMGTVYKAHQKSLNRTVAIKVLSPALAKNSVNVERFSLEARASAALNHPNIVQCFSVGEHGGLHYLAMELLVGETSLERLSRSGPLPLLDVLEIGRQCALALAHAHRKGILHRDVKPGNIMLIADSNPLNVKLMDLGLARIISEDCSLTQTGTALGTPWYISPEQARGMRTLTPACDLYALGITLLHLVSGKPPFAGKTDVEILTAHIKNPVPEPREFKADLPEEFCAILRTLMQKHPLDRDISAEELAAKLERIAAKLDPAALPVRTRKARVQVKRIKRRVVPQPKSHSSTLLAVVAVVLVCLFVLNALSKPEKRVTNAAVETLPAEALSKRAPEALFTPRKIETADKAHASAKKGMAGEEISVLQKIGIHENLESGPGAK